MLRWRFMPYPWFTRVVHWALYRAILECTVPSEFAAETLSHALGLPRMCDDNIARMCTAILIASKDETRWFQPTPYQFAVMDHIFFWVFEDYGEVVEEASDNIVRHYIAPTRELSCYTTRDPSPGDYMLEATGAPPRNPRLSSVDPQICLFLESNEGENNDYD